ncbi:MAG: hypothetical protein ISR78_01315 [Spirochaetia bacterium]|nr:hypothetical protein [Spirochaetia bacterium]
MQNSMLRVPNGKTVQLGSLQRKLLKQPLVVHSHRKWNQLVGSASLVRLRIKQAVPVAPVEGETSYSKFQFLLHESSEYC